MRSSWLYFATRSLRAGAPVLIWPCRARRRGRRSSRPPSRPSGGTSPRCSRSPARGRTASIVSVSVPIWFTLTRIELATPRSMPCCSRSGFVTKRSSPTSCTRSPRSRGQRAPTRPSRPPRSRPRSRRSGTRRRARARTPASPPTRARAPRSGSGRRGRSRSPPGRARSRRARGGRRARPPRGSPRSRPRSTRGRARSRPRRRRRREPALAEHLLQRVVDLGADPQRLARTSSRRPARP